MNRANRRRFTRFLDKANIDQLETKTPVMVGNCYLCNRQLYSNDKTMSLHGRYLCDNETITQMILALEAQILNDIPRSS